MSILNSVYHLAAAYRRRQALVRTERQILALPTEIRKDIGWPDPTEERVRFRRSLRRSQ